MGWKYEVHYNSMREGLFTQEQAYAGQSLFRAVLAMLKHRKSPYICFEIRGGL